jgi:hypothetical protein
MNVPVAQRLGRSLVVLALFVALVAVQADTNRPMVAPIDEAAQEAALITVRTNLLSALRSEDTDRVMTFIAEDVQFQALPNQTKSQIRRGLLSRFGDRSLAQHVIRALTLGGTFTTTRGSRWGAREFCAPYVYSAFPAEYDHVIANDDFPWVVIGKHVPLRSTPDPDAPPRRYLSYDIVYVTPVGENAARNRRGQLWPYRVIEEPRALAGFVPADSVRNPQDFHVCFGMRSGQWKVTEIADDVFPSLRDQRTSLK